MAAIMDTINYYYHKLDELADPVSKEYSLCGSIWPCLILVICYLYFVNNLGPKLMANREPFKLEKVMRIYNTLQIIFCGYLTWKALSTAWMTEYAWFCEPIEDSTEPRKHEVVQLVWYFYMLKIFDLLDTVFFILRKKYKQASFLHLYHHAGMVFAGYFGTRYLPGGHGTLIGPLNCFVHMIMYSYYLAASFKINLQWCKKHITQLQLLQFFLLGCHFLALFLIKDCLYPHWIAFVMLPQNFFMMILFGEFYYTTYIKQSTKKDAERYVSADVSNGKAKQQ